MPDAGPLMIILYILQIKRNFQLLQAHPEAPRFHEILSQWRIWCQKPPKGFEKYFPGRQQPKNGDKKTTSQQQQPSAKDPPPPPAKPPSRSPGSDGSKDFDPRTWSKEWNFSFGGGGGKGDQNRWATIALMTTLGVLGLLAYNEMRYKEITWKEFISSYLSRGIVEKLEVVNKKWVRVKLLPGNQVDGSNVLWFNIGSVDTFERNLENIQLEMNIDPPNHVPVIYKSEMDG